MFFKGGEDDQDIYLMPVPSSYNDIPTTSEARDHVGPVTYEKTFFIPSSWRSNKRIWLRFGSVCYSAQVVSNKYKTYYFVLEITCGNYDIPIAMLSSFVTAVRFD